MKKKLLIYIFLNKTTKQLKKLIKNSELTKESITELYKIHLHKANKLIHKTNFISKIKKQYHIINFKFLREVRKECIILKSFEEKQGEIIEICVLNEFNLKNIKQYLFYNIKRRNKKWLINTHKNN